METTEIVSACKYCKAVIHKDAKVCSTCGKHQNWFNENIAHSISFLVFVLAVVQLVFATMERSKAEDAYKEAVNARNEITKAKEDIKATEKKLSEVGDAVVIIAEILPRSTGYGAGMTKEDKDLLNKNIAVIEYYSKSINGRNK